MLLRCLAKIIGDSNPDEIVCRGAGVAAGIKERSEEIKDIVITDICPFTLGVEVVGDIMSPIISKNEILPCSRVSRYTTIRDNQQKIDFNIYQGENRTASKNLLLEKFTVAVPKKPKGDVFVDVRFSYDINGIFDIDVNCPMTKVEIHKALGSGGGLSETELSARKQEIEKLKIHPRDMEQNKYILERAERLYEECNQEQREMLDICISHFIDVLDTQNMRLVKRSYARFAMQLEMIERTLFHFSDFDMNLWRETLGEPLYDENADDNQNEFGDED